MGCFLYPRIVREGLRLILERAKRTMKKGFVFFIGAGKVWKQFTAHLNDNFLLLRCVGKRNLPHEMGLPRWALAGTEEGSKRLVETKFGLTMLLKIGVGRVKEGKTWLKKTGL